MSSQASTGGTGLDALRTTDIKVRRYVPRFSQLCTGLSTGPEEPMMAGEPGHAMPRHSNIKVPAKYKSGGAYLHLFGLPLSLHTLGYWFTMHRLGGCSARHARPESGEPLHSHHHVADVLGIPEFPMFSASGHSRCLSDVVGWAGGLSSGRIFPGSWRP